MSTAPPLPPLPPLSSPAPPRAAAEAGRGWARSRLRRFLLGATDAPRWERPALLGLLSGTLLLYLWDLAREGWGNEYYAAAVQAGTQSWRAFFFGSFDASNFITVDKPPFSLWVMELSARVFGLSSWSILVPQAIAGALTVFVTYLIVRRWFGPAAALLAGLALALTPVAALMFRFDDPDAILTLLLVLGAYALVRAVEGGRARWLVGAGALIGCAFLAKSLQAYLVLPAFGLTWLVAAPGDIGRRLWQLGAGIAALFVASAWWVAAVELTPASSRPYIGGSTSNSVLDLIFNYNGLGRLTGEGAGPGGGGIGGVGFSGATGIGRLFNDEMGGQISWLLPFAGIALVAGLAMRGRAPRTDRRRAGYILWGAWALTHLLVFSFMSGIVHSYYTVAMAPAVGALVGMGGVDLWRARSDPRTRWVLSLAIAATGLWAYALLDRSPSFLPWLRVGVPVLALAAAAALLVDGARLSRRVGAAAAVAGAVAVLAGPAAYAVQTAGTTHQGATPSAGPTVANALGPGGGRGFGRAFPGGGTSGPRAFPGVAPGGVAPGGAAPGAGGSFGGRGQAANAELAAFLEANAGSSEWVAATVGANSAAPIQLATGRPVMAIGGFTGSDPAPTLERFIALVRAGQVRYFVAGGGGGRAVRGGGLGGGSGDGAQIQSWVQQHGRQVGTGRTGGVTVYDLSSAAA
jgi:4-amino-4-deoxy-L-arabinose transferase-like glycosyltransferase